MYAGGLISPMQWCFSDLVCQPLVTSYVIDAYLCLAMLHAWTGVPWSTSTWCSVWWWIPTKAERPAGEDRRVALSTSGSTRFRRMPTLYCSYLRCGDLRSPEVTERRNGSLGLRDDDDDDEGWLVSKMEGKTNFSRHLRHLQAVRNRDCCLKIIDVGCNLKPFDVEADRKCIFHFRP